MMGRYRLLTTTAALAALGWIAGLHSTQAVSAQEIDLNAIKYVSVPAESIDQDLPDGWLPLDRKRVDERLRLLKIEHDQPALVRIESAEYSAEFRHDRLADGELDAQVVSVDSQRRLLRLSPLNIALTELNWTDGAAVWGTTAHGQSVVEVAQTQRTLQGSWSAIGRVHRTATIFALRFPPADVTRLRLKIPAGMRPASSAGIVSQLDEQSDPAFQQWRIDLGQQNECQISIQRSNGAYRSDADSEPAGENGLILVEPATRYTIRDTGTDIQLDLQLQILNQPRRTIDVTLPASVRIFSATYGTDLRLRHEVIADDDSVRTVRLTLPDSILGTTRRIRLECYTPSEIGRLWRMPKFSVADGLFLQGQVLLEVLRPLQVHQFETAGLQQSRAVMDGATQESLTFQQYLPDASLDVYIGYPLARFRADTATHVDIRQYDWQFRSQIRWRADSGNQFRCRVLIAAGWTVTDVQFPQDDPDSQVVSWDFDKQPNRASLLAVEFAGALGSGQSRTVVIRGRRTPQMSRREISIPVVSPLNVLELDQTIAVTAPNEVLRGETLDSWMFQQITPTEAPEFAREAVFWDEVGAADANTLTFYSKSRHARRRVRLDSQLTAYRTSAVVQAAVSDENVRESFHLRILPIDAPVERFLVFITQQGPPLDWMAVGPQNPVLAARRMPASDLKRLGLPESGELWEITFAQGIRRAVELTARRRQPRNLTDRIGLVVFPESDETSGELIVSLEDGASVELIPDNLSREMLVGKGRRWKYNSTDASLTLRPIENEAQSLQATLELNTVISGVASMPDVYLAAFELRNPSRLGFQFELPPGAALISASVNGSPVRPHPIDRGYRIAAASQERTRVAIKYHLPAQRIGLQTARTIGIPHTNFEVVSLNWTVGLPSSAWLAAYPSELAQLVIPERIGLLHRLFGPLIPVDPEPADVQTRKVQRLAEFRAQFAEFAGESETAVAIRSLPDEIEIWRLTGTDPHSFSVRLVNRQVVRQSAWLAFWAAIAIVLLVRMSSATLRQLTILKLFVLCAAAAVILPAVYASIAGASLAGLSIASVIPRAFLSRRIIQPATASPSGHSTANYSLSRSAGMVLLAIMVHQAALAQTPDPEQPSQFARTDVLVPTSSPAVGIESQLVYVNAQLWRELNQPAAPKIEDTDYLIERADHVVTLDPQSPVMTTKLELSLLHPQREVTIELPLQGASLGGTESCLLDGQAYPARRSPLGNSLLITIPGQPAADDESSNATAARGAGTAVRHNLQLTLYPPSPQPEKSPELNVAIPPVAAATIAGFSSSNMMSAELLTPDRSLQLDVHTLPDALPSKTQIPIGRLSQLQLRYSDSSQPDLRNRDWNATVVSLVDVGPNRAQWNARLRLAPVAGRLADVVIDLPSGAQQLSVTGDKVLAVSPVAEAVDSRLVEFREPLTEPVELNLSFIVPFKNSMGIVSVDGWYPFTSTPEISLESSQLGISAAPNLQLVETSINANAAARLTEPLVSGTFRSLYAYELQRPTEMTFDLVLRTPQRTVSQNQEVRISRSGMEWSLSAEIQTSQTAAFQHHLRLPRQLQIEGVSVLEDGAERLVRWSRLDDRLTLFLSGKTSGIQNLIMTGFTPVRLDKQLELPTIRFEQADVAESFLSISHAPDLALELHAEPGFPSQPTEIPAALESGITYLGRFQVAPGVKLPRITVREQKQPLAAQAISLLERNQSGSFEYQLTVELVGPTAVKSSIPIVIRSPDIERLSVRVGESLLSPVKTGSERYSYSIEPDPAANTETDVEITVSGTLIENAIGMVLLPEISLPTINEIDHLVVCGFDEQQQVEFPNAAEVAWERLSELDKRLIQSRLESSRKRAYRLSRLDGFTQLRVTSRPDLKAAERVGLIEQALWLRSRYELAGQTRIYLRIAPIPGKLTITFPPDLDIHAVLRDGRSDAVVSETGASGESQITIELDAGSSGVTETFDLLWTADLNGRWPLRATQLPIPQVDVSREVPVYLMLNASPQLQVFAPSGVEPLDEFTALLKRFESYAEICRHHAEYSKTRPRAWEVLQQIRNRLVELTGSNAPQLGSRSMREARLMGVQEEFNDLATKFSEPGFAAAPPVVAAEAFWETGEAPVLWASLSNSSEPAPDSSVRIWIIPDQLLRILLALIMIPIVLVLGRLILSNETAIRLWSHPAVPLFCLGAVLWLALSWNLVGAITMLCGLLRWVRAAAAPVTPVPAA